MIRTYKPTNPATRFRKSLVRDVDKVRPLKALTKGISGPTGRSYGEVVTRHKERGAKKLYRVIDFKRNKFNIPAKVASIEYDPNRGANIALLHYADGEKRYILSPEGLKTGTQVISGPGSELNLGNCLPLSEIPLGTSIHNIELNPGAGGVMVRGAGNSAQILAKEGEHVNIKLPSGEVKKVLGKCMATVGVLSNMDLRNVVLGKAGRHRHLGVRPTVRGVAMSNPKKDHPHGGSYKSTGVGMDAPKSPWGWKTKGVKSRKRSRTDYTIVKDRRAK